MESPERVKGSGEVCAVTEDPKAKFPKTVARPPGDNGPPVRLATLTTDEMDGAD
jgi:hypothetical protein